MISDKLATFLDGTALNTGGAASYLIGDGIDLGIANQLYAAEGLYWIVLVDTTATSGGSATLDLELITDGDSAFGSPVVIARLPAAIAVATLVAGLVVACIPLPIGAPFERYISVRQVTAVAAFTAGKLTSFIANNPVARRAYADGLIAGTY